MQSYRYDKALNFPSCRKVESMLCSKIYVDENL